MLPLPGGQLPRTEARREADLLFSRDGRSALLQNIREPLEAASERAAPALAGHFPASGLDQTLGGKDRLRGTSLHRWPGRQQSPANVANRGGHRQAIGLKAANGAI